MPDLRSELKRIRSQLRDGGSGDSARRGHSPTSVPDQPLRKESPGRPVSASKSGALSSSVGRPPGAASQRDLSPGSRSKLSLPGSRTIGRSPEPRAVPGEAVSQLAALRTESTPGQARRLPAAAGAPAGNGGATGATRQVQAMQRGGGAAGSDLLGSPGAARQAGGSEPQIAALKSSETNRRSPPVQLKFQPLPKGAPTRKGLFRPPASWLGSGGKTQCRSGEYRGAVDIVIGIDFGTSYTKAAVGFMDKIFPVSWSGVSGCSPDYLLPSEYSQLSNGALYLGQHPDASLKEIHADLKLPFIESGVSNASTSRASSFIALVLRYIRAWVYAHHASKLGSARIRWQLNIGAPSNGLENKGLVHAYRVLTATAWQRSLELDPLRLAGDPSTLWKVGGDLEDLIDLRVVPEFVAQMAGYMQSPQRQRGLHALVDVGGGTLDVVTFNVHQVEEEDTFPFLVPEVSPLGTHGLLQNRLVGIETRSTVGVIDELAPIESAASFARSAGVAEQRVIDRDERFKNDLRRVIKRVFDITRSRRYRLSDAWTQGVRTFFTGGGSSVDLYREALATTDVPSRRGLLITPLPPHRNVDGFGGGASEYQRISVACGLALDAFTLGRIVPAREVEDDRPIQTSPRAERPDRDELYPK